MTTVETFPTFEQPSEFEGTDERDVIVSGFHVILTRATINTLAGSDVVNTSLGNGRNRITLGDDIDTATAGPRDRISGDAGDDVLIGADRARLDGGEGTDILNLNVGRRVQGQGGEGADIFIIGQNPSAVIRDFRLEDFLAIQGIEDLDTELFEQIFFNEEEEVFQLLYDGDLVVSFSEIQEDEIEQITSANYFAFPASFEATEFEGTDDPDVVNSRLNVALSRATINTLGGDDVVTTFSGDGRNRITLGDDDDLVTAGSRDRVDGGRGDDTLIGATRSRLDGGRGGDILIGANRARLNGGDGDDLLDLSVGNQVQGTGGDGEDTFIIGNNPRAVITDFIIEDRLAIKGIEDPNPQLLEQTFNEEEEIFQLLYAGEVVVNFAEIREEDIGQFGPDNFSFI
ncbi:hypothetical protein [Gloeocapsa sp. PCC 73106]|uniref:hypothetical protein n=1 Tax=Gloeocapsa sp. PCC 73106 TaxID=102232 RepID=UPI0002ACC48D|nr:hypothetical protein [Gloeocapsa sp. PCC 73106]ELR96746.1 hypothetical protein GLO73106DRAFT_00005440 [Gloeocapsa sp. PCC 73106]